MRISGIFKPADLPSPDPATAADLKALFDALRPGDPDPEIDRGHAGIAIVAHNPKLALALAQTGRIIALDTYWGHRTDLREIALQTVNRRYAQDFSFEARRAGALNAGLSEAQLAALPDAPAALFDAEQRLVIAYSLAVMQGPIGDDLVDAAKAAFGEKAVMELSTLVGFWSMWAMILNAADPAWT